MKFFVGGELDSQVGEVYREIRNKIENKLRILEVNNYGENIEKIGIIPIIISLSPEAEKAGFFKERKLVRKKEKRADIRLRIDIEKFIEGTMEEKKLLIIKNILQSIRVIGTKVKKGFDARGLEQDILNLFDLSVEEIDQL